MKAPVARLVLTAEPGALDVLRSVEADVRSAGAVEAVEYVGGNSFVATVELAPDVA